jgi:hypothetical protein
MPDHVSRPETLGLSPGSGFILMWTRVGEDITEAIIGTNTVGTMNGFLAGDFKRTGRPGKKIDTGEEKELGVSRTIEFNHNTKNRN